MKNTPFLQPHKPPSRSKVRGLRIMFVCAALLVAWASPRWFASGLLSATTPLWKMRAALAESVVSAGQRLMSKRELREENARLREENARLALKGALYDELKDAVSRLEALVGRGEAENGNILGRVLASPSASPYDTFLIDVGSNEGVAVGDAVVFDATIALGRIDLVSGDSSRAALFSSPGMREEVYVGTTSARLSAEGRGGGIFIVRVPKDITVSAGDALLLPGTLRAIGFVRTVESRDADAFQTVYAVMPVNLFETREVLIEPSFLAP